MRARDFLIEYSREKTATVFGNKLIAALAKDKSYMIQQQGTEHGLGKARAFLDQKAKVGSEITTEQRQYILDLIMHVLENADPTQNKEYVQWLAKVYANQGVKIEDILARGQNALATYNEFKTKKILPAEQRDIGQLTFSDLEYIAASTELRQALAAKQEQDAAKAMPRGESEVVFENDKVRIIVPHDKEAACYYGQGTTWCTAATQSNNMFDTYNRNGAMYILLPKQPQYDGEKYQLHFSSGQFMDEQDTPVDNIVELLDMRFGNLVEFFREREPEINDWLEFTPDEVLKPLIAKIKTAVMQHVDEKVNEWESDDDYWYDYLRGKGYVFPEGHEDEGQIDWEKAYDNDESYTSWNYDVSDFISMIREAVDLTPEDVREMVQDVDTDYVSDAHDIRNLDQLFSFRVEMNKGRDGDGGVAAWIKDHIYIKKTGGDGAWDVSLLYTNKDGKRVEYPIH